MPSSSVKFYRRSSLGQSKDQQRTAEGAPKDWGDHRGTDRPRPMRPLVAGFDQSQESRSSMDMRTRYLFTASGWGRKASFLQKWKGCVKF